MTSDRAPRPTGSTLPPPRPEIMDVIAAGRTLPMLDIADFIADKPGAMEQLAADIACIQESLGFYYIVNFGFDPQIIEDAYAENFKLFSLTEEQKARHIHVDHMQGYWPARSFVNVRPGYENEDDDDKVAGWAGWTFLRDREPDDPKVLSNKRHRAMNKWPDPALVPDFRRVIDRYQAEMLKLGLKLVQVYAVALGQRPDYFDADFTNPEWYARTNYALGNPKAKGLAASPHSDHSFLTLLPISPVPGLEVRTPDGQWLKVEYKRGGIVVNSGEWLNRVSNGRFLATPHRVLSPTETRISMPVFINPHDDAIDTPVPGAIAPGEQPKHERTDWHSFFIGYIDGYTNATLPQS